MRSFFGKSLTRKLALSIGAVVSVALLTSGFIAHIYAGQSLRKMAYSQLETVRNLARIEARNYWTGQMKNAALLASSRETSGLLSFCRHRLAVSTTDDASPANSYELLAQAAQRRLAKLMEDYDLLDLLILFPDRPQVVYSIRQGFQSEADTFNNEPQAATIKGIWKKVVTTHHAALSDFTSYGPKQVPCVCIGTPIPPLPGESSWIMITVVEPRKINKLFHQLAQLGAGDQILLVTGNGTLRSLTRSTADNEILKKGIDTALISKALHGKAGVETVTDSDGRRIISAYAPMGLPAVAGTGFDWVLIAQRSEADALALSKWLDVHFTWMVIVFIVVGSLIGYFISRSLVAPVRTLSLALAGLSDGDLNVTVEDPKREDEVGELFRSFKEMAESLRNQTGELTGGIDKLGIAIHEVSATSAQLASSSAETSTAVSEISTTVEEVRQTARLAKDKADDITGEAGQMQTLSEEGRKVSEETVDGLQLIEREMNFVAESVMRLSEQSQSIGEIIDSVRDLADQVNLLSVNAAIEAAKAGENGKGFGVVAQEMRSLADQSREETEKIKQILTEIQKAAGSSVMAMERAAKAVTSGLATGTRSGEVIESLYHLVLQGAESAMQIAASSQEQLVGMEQLVLAIKNIQEASSQNTDAARQLEDAAHNLEFISSALQKVASHFKV